MYFNTELLRGAVPMDGSTGGDLPVNICEVLTVAGIETYEELWTKLFVEQEEVFGLTPYMVKKIQGFFVTHFVPTTPTATEKFYAEMLSRKAQRGEIKKPDGGIGLHLRRNFRPKADDEAQIALQLQKICGLRFEERQVFLEYFGLQFGAAATKSQMARLRGISVSQLNRIIADAEEVVTTSSEMNNWMHERHPEAWPA